MYEILKMVKTEVRAIMKYRQKKDMTPENKFGFKLLQHHTNSRDSAVSIIYLFPKLKTHLPGRYFGNQSVENAGVSFVKGADDRNKFFEKINNE